MPIYIQHKETGKFLWKSQRGEVTWNGKGRVKVYAHTGAAFNSLAAFLQDYHWNQLPVEEKSRFMYRYSENHVGYKYGLWWNEFKKGKSLEDLIPDTWEIKEWNP